MKISESIPKIIMAILCLLTMINSWIDGDTTTAILFIVLFYIVTHMNYLGDKK